MELSTERFEDSGFIDTLSLFDEQFTIENLQQAIADSKGKSDTIILSVRKAIHQAAINDQDNDGTRYVVDLDAELKRALDDGKIKLVTNEAGEMFAQIRDDKGHFGKKLPIKEELDKQGISVEAAELALQMNVIGDQLHNIIEIVKSIENRVTEVLEGQHNDRLGLYYSGMSLYLESRSVNDVLLKKQITAQALKALSDANSQMIQEIRTNIRYLVTDQYLNAKKKTLEIEKHLSIIHQCYDIVYRTSFLKAAIYHENREIQAMLTAMDEYGRFVEKLIVPYAGKLSELDKHNQFIAKGTWGRICNTLQGCNELKMKISQNHTYYLTGGK